jgi:hypothetical protein
MTFQSTLLITFMLLLASWFHPGSLSGYDRRAGNDAFVMSQIREQYLLLHEPALSPEAFFLGMLGYRSLVSRGLVRNDSLLTIIDFSLPSSADRFFVVNLRQSIVVCKSLVSHGRNSGELYARRFSNKIQSHQSALGFYITGEPYLGAQGYSLQLNGVDTGYNDLSRTRAIVIHGAGYATQDYISRYGRLGRSFGCPALPPAINADVINLIKYGSILFGYFPDPSYFRNSVVLQRLSEMTGNNLF